MKPTTQLLALLAIVVFAWGCKKTTSGNEFGINGNVYISGDVVLTDVSGIHPLYLAYWKNKSFIPITEANTIGHTSSIYADGNNVYVGGDFAFMPTIWKNNTSQFLSSTNNGSILDLKVINGSIYAVGYLVIDNQERPVYWKNGVQTILSNQEGRANKIAISGTDVFVGGRVAIYPVIWKNGTTIYNPLVSGEVYSMCAANGHLYTALRKHAQVILLTDSTEVVLAESGSASSVIINNNDVYVTGIMDDSVSHFVAWKNGILENSLVPNEIIYKPIGTIKNGIPYIIGNDSLGHFSLWSKGIKHSICDTLSFFNPTSIFIQ